AVAPGADARVGRRHHRVRDRRGRSAGRVRPVVTAVRRGPGRNRGRPGAPGGRTGRRTAGPPPPPRPHVRLVYRRVSPDGSRVSCVSSGPLHVVGVDGSGATLLAEPEKDYVTY